MSIELVGRFNQKDFSFSYWSELLQMGRAHGWVPVGTVKLLGDCATPPYNRPDPSWEGHYMANDGQIVTAAVSANLVKALQKALLDLPSEDGLSLDCFGYVEYPTVRRQEIEAFIYFCAQGEFAIY